LAPTVAAAITTVDSDVPFALMPLADQVKASIGPERLVATLSGTFGGLALLLASLGLYGVASHGVVRRRTEIGVRIALGAQRHSVILGVLREGLISTMVGILLGLLGATAVAHYIRGMLFGVQPLEPAILIVTSVSLAAVATVAAFVPAFRAAPGDPLVALRCE
jgi:ABC-type antimicrobial peptide transport system permease subunit